MGFLKRLLVWLFALMMIGGVIKHADVRMGLKATPKINYKIPYTYPIVQENRSRINIALQAILEGKANSQQTIEEINRAAYGVLKSNPLSSDALQSVASADFLRTQDINENTFNLIQEALQRNGRNRRSLRLLMLAKLSAGEIDAAFDYIENLIRLDPKSIDNLMPIIESLYSRTEYHEKVLSKLSTAPLWAYDFLQKNIPDLKEQDIESWEPVMRSFIDSNNHLILEDYIPRLYVNHLIRLGMYSNAHDFISHLFPDEFISMSSLVFNPDFKDIGNIPAFNWELFSNSNVIAEYEKNGGVFISFNAKERTRILHQYSIENSGEAWDVAFDYEFNANDAKGYFWWDFSCSSTRETFFTYRFDENSTNNISRYVSVPLRPERCESVLIQLWGEPGIYTSRFSMNLKGVRVRATR